MMSTFIFNKLFYGLLVLLGVVFVIFGLFNILPVDPARLTLGQRADIESVEAINKEFGLDKPKYVQLALYLNDLSPIAVHENTKEAKEKYNYTKLFAVSKEKALVLKMPYLRRSYQTKENVSEILARTIPTTVLLAITSILLAIIIGIPLGVIGALKQHSWFDNIAMSISVLWISAPSFVTAMVLSLYFGYKWHDFTGLEVSGPLFWINDYGEEVLLLKNLILPTIALGTRPVAIIYQLTRSSMLDALGYDYVRTARAKGLSESTIIIKHTLRNALNPVITSISGWFASLLAGAYFVEIVFNLDGLGSKTVQSLNTFDFPVVMGSILFAATVFIIMNFLVDMLYAILDPRIRIGK
ncbi:MAG TPA: ABC transporter permease [Chitinophagales bacterium]|nr:ABC transporter permease [Chitinophagales bacterium]HNB48351.1 ABC transporter permease [Chitinophagales bacterium]HNG71505.1 ABC transporter permease [Chitinophagales bacterium]HNO02860.1 ABC transporter permease [Chitinophagales bacterium]